MTGAISGLHHFRVVLPKRGRQPINPVNAAAVEDSAADIAGQLGIKIQNLVYVNVEIPEIGRAACRERV